MTGSAIELRLWGKLVLVCLVQLKVEVHGLGFFLSGIHPFGVIWWALAGTVIELLLGLLLFLLVCGCWQLLFVACSGPENTRLVY